MVAPVCAIGLPPSAAVVEIALEDVVRVGESGGRDRRPSHVGAVDVQRPLCPGRDADSVHDDVVEAHRENVVVRAECQQRHSQQRIPLEIES